MNCRPWQPWPPPAATCTSLAPPNCESRKAIASRRSRPASARWGATSRSSPMASTSAARGASPVDGPTPATIIGSPWRLRSPAWPHQAKRSSEAPKRSTSRIPGSSTPSPRWVVRTDKVYLVGFMGAGKTTLARALGARLEWRVEDVDERIETREGRAISSIFAREGEAYFRDVERQVLLDLLPVRHAVVATGGGTFADPENRALINRDGLSVWLDVPRSALIVRVPAAGRRPLAADRPGFEHLYQTRRAAYRQAHLR